MAYFWCKRLKAVMAIWAWGGNDLRPTVVGTPILQRKTLMQFKYIIFLDFCYFEINVLRKIKKRNYMFSNCFILVLAFSSRTKCLIQKIQRIKCSIIEKRCVSQ